MQRGRTFILLVILLCTIAIPVAAEPNSDNTVTIGALLSLTGGSATHSLSANAALDIATEDINTFLADMDRDDRINVVVEDTTSTPEGTLAALKKLEAQGINIFIGPEDSASLAAVREYADDHNLILVSGSSTAPSIAIPGDTTFRLVPDDTYLAEGVVGYLVREGSTVIIPLAREDVWADDWIELLTTGLVPLGGTVTEPVRYDGSETDHSASLAQLKDQITAARNTYGTENVAVYTVTFDEIADILSEASGDDVLSSVRWYGSDLAGLQDYDDKALAFAADVGFTYAKYGDDFGWRNTPVLSEIEGRIDGIADPLALNDYDGLWLIAYTYLISDTTDSDTFRWVLPLFGENYRGVTGRLTIGENGDRIFAFYTFETVEESDGTYVWVPQLQWIKDPESGSLWRLVIDGVPSDELLSGSTAPMSAETGNNRQHSLPAIFSRTFSL